ncbi:MAG: DUF695 domain-containing protein [Bacteroidia bacterium]|nr:DUF695 domain-containing protein [Bacteroidia bacterium]
MGILSPEAKFWNWFQQSQNQYLELENQNLEEKFSQLGQKIKEVDEDLTFAISPLDDQGKREFIISADGVSDAFPAVIKLVSQAPPLPLWTITPFRAKVEMDEYHIDLGHRTIKAEEVRFEFSIIEARLELHLYIQGYHPEAEDILIACQILLDSLLGEYDAATKIRFLAFHDLAELEAPDQLPQLELLPMLVDDLNRGRLDGSLPIIPENTELLEGYEVEELYALLQGMFHNLPNFVLINPNFYQFAKKREFPWLLGITIQFDSEDPTGLPGDTTNQILDVMEGEILDLLASKSKTYLVYKITWNRQRQVYFHLKDWLITEESVKDWVKRTALESSYEIAYERDWESTRAMLLVLFEAQKDSLE